MHSLPYLPLPLLWQPWRVQLPAGVNLSWDNLEAISSSGVIAAIGNAGNGDQHALLLVPVSLRLLNGKTTDFDGKTVTKLIPAPENPQYDADKLQQSYQDIHGNIVQDDTLGPKSPGAGRNGGNGCYYDLIVAAQATPLPWLHYKWERRAFDYTWLILKQHNPAGWKVVSRYAFGPQDDTNSTFSNETPSAGKSEFYNYDDPGIRYDPSTSEDPDVHFDSLMNIGDYRYCEKVFSYKVLYSLDQPGWSEDTADWKDGVEMFVSHKITVQQVKKTGVALWVSLDWKSLQNLLFVGKINPRIDTVKVRQIVGGNLPITIDPDATLYNQVDPPDVDQVDTSN